MLLAFECFSARAAIPAFPGAEGFGAKARGGRGGAVLIVDTLEDYDPRADKPLAGSLRAACAAKGPRIVVFRVAGTIRLKAPLSISEPYLTIAGQSAPGGGICLREHVVYVRAPHVVLRHLRFRPGDEYCLDQLEKGKHVSYDALSIGKGSHHVIVDHCSASWATDEVLSITQEGVDNVTVQWCMITESLNKSTHRKGEHGYGSLLRTNGNVTFHHNLYAHHKSRTPRPGTYGEGCLLLDFRNNLVYNAVQGGYTGEDPARINYIANHVVRGPDSRFPYAFQIGGNATQMYVQDNRLSGFEVSGEHQWDLIRNARECNKRDEPFDVAPVQTDKVDDIFEKILACCGATLPDRDAVDARIIEEIRAGKGHIINSQSEVGGWPKLASGPAPADADRDGMSDEWELRHKLDPKDKTDAAGDLDGDGYTNIEEALNGTNPRAKD